MFDTKYSSEILYPAKTVEGNIQQYRVLFKGGQTETFSNVDLEIREGIAFFKTDTVHVLYPLHVINTITISALKSKQSSSS